MFDHLANKLAESLDMFFLKKKTVNERFVKMKKEMEEVKTMETL